MYNCMGSRLGLDLETGFWCLSFVLCLGWNLLSGSHNLLAIISLSTELADIVKNLLKHFFAKEIQLNTYLPFGHCLCFLHVFCHSADSVKLFGNSNHLLINKALNLISLKNLNPHLLWKKNFFLHNISYSNRHVWWFATRHDCLAYNCKSK